MTSALTSADLDIVKRIAVFRGLNPLMLDRLIAPAVAHTLAVGDVVFRQGDPAMAFFILVDGWVKLYRVTISGDEAVIHVFAKGDSFAEAVAFTGHAYPATAEVVSEARVVRIPAEHVVNCIRRMPEIALAMIASTSQHLHHLVQQVEQLKAQTGVQRVAEFLVSLCEAERGKCNIALPYDKVLIAGRLGIKPESLSRAFAKLRSVGVEVRAAHVVIGDIARLRDLAMGDRGATRESLREAR
ncbi:MAG: Crp/Fnr family transcriptional regulator [Rhizobiales bacterium]|nr:Crp/Fnr family transcriptional regulator [Hyphomicrobiales bacterium]